MPTTISCLLCWSCGAGPQPAHTTAACKFHTFHVQVTLTGPLLSRMHEIRADSCDAHGSTLCGCKAPALFTLKLNTCSPHYKQLRSGTEMSSRSDGKLTTPPPQPPTQTTRTGLRCAIIARKSTVAANQLQCQIMGVGLLLTLLAAVVGAARGESHILIMVPGLGWRALEILVQARVIYTCSIASPTSAERRRGEPRWCDEGRRAHPRGAHPRSWPRLRGRCRLGARLCLAPAMQGSGSRIL